MHLETRCGGGIWAHPGRTRRIFGYVRGVFAEVAVDGGRLAAFSVADY